MIMKSFRAATPSVFAAYFDLCLPERIYQARYCRAFPAPATALPTCLLNGASSNLSQVSCAQTRMRACIGWRIESPGAAQACRALLIEMVGRPIAAPVKCDLDRVCVDQARTAAVCPTASVKLDLHDLQTLFENGCSAMHKVSKVWETITAKKELLVDQILEIKKKCQRVVPLISTTTAFGVFSCSNHIFSSPFHSWPKEVQSIFLMFSEVVARAKKELCGSRMSSRQVTTPSSTKKMIPTQT